MNISKSHIVIIGTACIAVLATILAIFFALLWYTSSVKDIANNADDGGPVCTQEAMMCPDGSYVGRQGPRCEFATCPSSGTSTSATKNLREKYGNIQVFVNGLYGISYPAEWTLNVQAWKNSPSSKVRVQQLTLVSPDYSAKHYIYIDVNQPSFSCEKNAFGSEQVTCIKTPTSFSRVYTYSDKADVQELAKDVAESITTSFARDFNASNHRGTYSLMSTYFNTVVPSEFVFRDEGDLGSNVMSFETVNEAGDVGYGRFSIITDTCEKIESYFPTLDSKNPNEQDMGTIPSGLGQFFKFRAQGNDYDLLALYRYIATDNKQLDRCYHVSANIDFQDNPIANDQYERAFVSKMEQVLGSMYAN